MTAVPTIRSQVQRRQTRVPIDMQKLADDARFNRFHAKVLLWCLLILIIDGYDIVGHRPAVHHAADGRERIDCRFHGQFGAVWHDVRCYGSGHAVRPDWSSLGPPLRHAVQCSPAAAGFTKDPISFSVVRFIAGLGLVACSRSSWAQMVEYSPKKIRSLMTALMTSGYALGASWLRCGQATIGEYGWQAVFIAAGCPCC